MSISAKEQENRMASVRSNRERKVVVGLKQEIVKALKDGDLTTARGAIEELFVVASSYESYLLDA